MREFSSLFRIVFFSSSVFCMIHKKKKCRKRKRGLLQNVKFFNGGRISFELVNCLPDTWIHAIVFLNLYFTTCLKRHGLWSVYHISSLIVRTFFYNYKRSEKQGAHLGCVLHANAHYIFNKENNSKFLNLVVFRFLIFSKKVSISHAIGWFIFPSLKIFTLGKVNAPVVDTVPMVDTSVFIC